MNQAHKTGWLDPSSRFWIKGSSYYGFQTEPSDKGGAIVFKSDENLSIHPVGVQDMLDAPMLHSVAVQPLVSTSILPIW